MIFENCLKFSKRRCEVHLWPIWTIMVEAKLDHSRVLVAKFHQNWSTLKGRSAGQRHTDRQTNSAENNDTSSLQSGQKSLVAKADSAGEVHDAPTDPQVGPPTAPKCSACTLRLRRYLLRCPDYSHLTLRVPLIANKKASCR